MEFDELPGFRFHPTEQELLDFYLTKAVSGQDMADIIGFLNIYNHEPWDLPGLAKIGEREWYFLVHREAIFGRPRRTTEKGYWKATGSDRPIRCSMDLKRLLGHKKTLVFYRGRAPRGSKTDWVMNEYRLPGNFFLSKEMVLCKVYRKATPLKVLEQRAAMEETARAPPPNVTSSSPPIIQENFSSYEQPQSFNKLLLEQDNVVHRVEGAAAIEEEEEDDRTGYPSQKVGAVPIRELYYELQSPKLVLDWSLDSFWLN
ncbi:hypothetical protein OIU84_006180 [Salix udensis]|uniref:NAC domain-containing protein n=1 Tax=Salix udensis TaxID=889485 RepID=A0AAD6P1W8_9ROSI|nr:hypothetical protein OIU84_006180 [Salix udensis]